MSVSLEQFLQSCNIGKLSPAFVNMSLASNELAAGFIQQPTTTHTTHIQNTSVSIGFHKNVALVKVGGGHLWADVLFVADPRNPNNYQAQEVHIGNAGRSGTNCYAADPTLLNQLADISRHVAPDSQGRFRDYDGVAVALLAGKIGFGGNKYMATAMSRGFEQYDTRTPEGRAGALGLVHTTLIERKAHRMPYRFPDNLPARTNNPFMRPSAMPGPTGAC